MEKEINEILSNIPIHVINNIIDSLDNRIDALYDNNFGIKITDCKLIFTKNIIEYFL